MFEFPEKLSRNGISRLSKFRKIGYTAGKIGG